MRELGLSWRTLSWQRLADIQRPSRQEVYDLVWLLREVAKAGDMPQVVYVLDTIVAAVEDNRWEGWDIVAVIAQAQREAEVQGCELSQVRKAINYTRDQERKRVIELIQEARGSADAKRFKALLALEQRIREDWDVQGST